MSTINAPSLQNTEYSGDDAAAFAHGYITLASALSGTKVRLNKLFAGTKIYDAKMINAALGGSTTVSLGFEYCDGSSGGAADALITATSTSSAARTESPVAPIVLAGDAYITATVGGATATGALDTVLSFEPRGV